METRIFSFEELLAVKDTGSHDPGLGSIVYVHKREERVLYVGRSSWGLRRATDRKNKAEKIDVVIVHFMLSRQEARELEHKLIYELQPEENRNLKHPPAGSDPEVDKKMRELARAWLEKVRKTLGVE